MIRGIFAKILLWFWASTALVSISVFAIGISAAPSPSAGAGFRTPPISMRAALLTFISTVAPPS